VVQALLEFDTCVLEGLESFLGSRDMIWDQIDVDRRYYAHNEFVGGQFKGVMLP
jgi:hypothetical protein